MAEEGGALTSFISAMQAENLCDSQELLFLLMFIKRPLKSESGGGRWREYHESPDVSGVTFRTLEPTVGSGRSNGSPARLRCPLTPSCCSVGGREASAPHKSSQALSSAGALRN